jgi:uncharacterized DUF497 family protein
VYEAGAVDRPGKGKTKVIGDKMLVMSASKSLNSDPDRIEIPAKTIDEERFLIIGKISNKCWSTIITYRKEKARIISVRRSRKKEIEIYES